MSEENSNIVSMAEELDNVIAMGDPSIPDERETSEENPETPDREDTLTTIQSFRDGVSDSIDMAMTNGLPLRIIVGEMVLQVLTLHASFMIPGMFGGAGQTVAPSEITIAREEQPEG